MVELPVWVNGLEKWISGLTSQTTCDDIIYALISHVSNDAKDLDIESYRIFEKWGEVSKPLRGRTKLLKVWRTWGADCHKVKFILQKVNNYLDSSCELSNSRRLKMFSQSKEKMYDRGTNSLSKVKRNNSYKKNQNKDGSDNCDMTNIKRNDHEKQGIDKIMHVVLNNDKKLQEQLHKIQKTDYEIEMHETRLHTVRAQKRGANYVQDAYLNENQEQEGSSSGEELFPAIKANDLEAYLHMCNEILRLENSLTEQKSKQSDLDKEIQQLTSNRIEDKIAQDHLDSQIFDEIKILKKDVYRSASLCDAQKEQIDIVQDTILSSEIQIQRKNAYMQSLLTELWSETSTGVPVTFDDISMSHTNFDFSNSFDELPSNHHRNGAIDIKTNSVHNDNLSLNSSNTSENSFFELTKQKSDDSRHHNTVFLSPEIFRKDSGIVDDDLYNTDIIHLINNFKNQTVGKNVKQNLISDSKSDTDEFIQENSNQFSKHSSLPFYITRLCKDKINHSDTESASDTGLSSMHSDETIPCLETLV